MTPDSVHSVFSAVTTRAASSSVQLLVETPGVVDGSIGEDATDMMCNNIYQNHTCSPDRAARYGQAVLGIISFVFIFIGNGLTILVILTDKQLHKMSFLVILNLAVGDFLLGIISQPPSIYYSFTCIWPSGSEGFLCQLVGFSTCLLCSVSILSLGFVSYERYLYVVCPFEYKFKMTYGRGIFTCAVLWIYSTIAAVFPVSGLWEGVGLVPDTALCNVQFHTSSVYMWAMIALFLVPSGAVTVYSYYKILRMARSFGRVEANYRRAVELNPVASTALNNGMHSCSDGTNTPDSQSVDGAPTTAPTTPVSVRKMSIVNARKVAKIFVIERKSTITVTVLIGTFFVCWAPYVIINVIRASSCQPSTFWETAISQWLCIFNSGCNPIVYGLTNKPFRDAVRRFLRRFGLCKRTSKMLRTVVHDRESSANIPLRKVTDKRLDCLRGPNHT
ncbi:5-hydroxytryptamine receptor 1D-like [Asterias rubens]|uniref:5-hydroxytryptamine receptor 1D-like n=1 Tax=Asterias rubens TaxID=7604 RepID=UPI001454F1AD|nr:5-hydroxytryptamine receptor 1D-like [Asterias rubens]